MKDNHGWGLAAMLVMSAILVIALIVIAHLYQEIFDKSLINNDYAYHEKLERNLKTSAEAYVKDSAITTDGDFYISADTLINKGYLDPLVDSNGHECDGYVKYIGDDKYQAYLKCGVYYATSGYVIGHTN